MAVSVMREEINPATFGAAARAGGALDALPLAEGERDEALEFLAARPVHTVYMASLLRDNGVVSPLNRGTFYGCRDREGALVGVALVGHATLVEARTDATLEAFARVARACTNSYLIRGEQDAIEKFWRLYAADDAARPRLVCREMLYEQHAPVAVREPVRELRQATLDDIELVMRVNALMAVAECGSNPMERDPRGFRVRTARRIEQGRVWVWRDEAGLVFKADVLAETPEAAYLEGVHVRADERGKGVGLRCMSQLGRELLRRADAICLVVNERAESAQTFYRKSGYRFRGYYDTIYLQPRRGD
ncbi:MAG: GNAT family N-acetyltransferase [Acidobacteria bacterium]|nr:GNAT family N-acetyltransferase [Acidobacteriota bacterium]